MKKCILFIAICCITLGIAAIAMSQTYFEDNFDDPNASADKWVPLSGEWEFKNDEYHQRLNSVNCMSVVLVLEDHPPRMAALEPSLEYWWNLGGWGNTRSQVESWGGTPGAHSNHTIEDDEWYNIKIVNTPDSYTVILNDEEVAKVDDDTENGVGRVGLATWSTVANYDDVIVYGPDGPLAVNPQSKLATTWGHLKSTK